MDTFKDLLRQYWFQPYSRADTGVLDSSGFEHTFLGELYEDGGDVLGFYNWVVTYYEEKADRFQYGASQDECYVRIYIGIYFISHKFKGILTQSKRL